jgi:hypothetical protein
MSDGTNFYNKLIGYVLWVERANSTQPEQIYALRESKLKLPLSNKEYKVTLRNLKLYLRELKKADPTIVKVMIDRLSRVGILRWSGITEEEINV